MHSQTRIAHTVTSTRLLVSMTLLGFLPQTLQAQSKNDDFVLQTYEIGDLLFNVVDHSYNNGDTQPRQRSGRTQFGGGGGGFGGGGGGGYGSGGLGTPAQQDQMGTANPASVTIDNVINVITRTVHPETWKSSGTGKGEVQPIGTAVVIWQTPEVHTQVGRLLSQLHQTLGDRTTFLIDARWLLLDSDELDRLRVENSDGTAQVNRQTLKEFTRRPTTIRGITNCFSGQLVYLVSGTRRNVVSGYIPVVGSLKRPELGHRVVSLTGGATIRFASEGYAEVDNSRSVGYQPLVEKPNLGALLEIRPTLMLGDKTAVVDLKAMLTSAGPRANDLGRIGSDAFAPTVDRVAIETQELATTFRMPLGEPTLVGGFTHAPQARPTPYDADNTDSRDAQGEGSAEHPQIYLILELRSQ